MQYAIELYYNEKTESQLLDLAKKLQMKKSVQSFWNGKHDRTLHWPASMMWMRLTVWKN